MDEMDQAHGRDTYYGHKLRSTRNALVELAEDDNTPQAVSGVLLGVADWLKKEQDHIVARWN